MPPSLWPRASSCYCDGQSSPHWFDSESFFVLLQAAGDRTVREVIAQFKYCSEPVAGQIAAEFRYRLAKDLSREGGRSTADRSLFATGARQSTSL